MISKYSCTHMATSIFALYCIMQGNIANINVATETVA